MDRKEEWYSAVNFKIFDSKIITLTQFELLYEDDSENINRKLIAHGHTSMYLRTIDGIMDRICSINIISRYSGFLNHLRSNYWTNKVMTKILCIGVTDVPALSSKIRKNSLNTNLSNKGCTGFHNATIMVFKRAIATDLPPSGTHIDEVNLDFCQGGW